MANPNATRAPTHEIQSIPLRGHLVHVWRQSEADKHPYAWRVLRGEDPKPIGQSEADSAAAAWEDAIAFVNTLAEAHRRASSNWGDAVDLAPRAEGGAAGLNFPLEHIYRCAYGVGAILEILTHNGLEDSKFREGLDEARPLSADVAEGLGYAGIELAHAIKCQVGEITDMRKRALESANRKAAEGICHE